MAVTKIDDRGLKTPIDLLDSEKIRFGTGNDLEIYHNGTDTGIVNNTGGLYIQNDGTVFIGDVGGNEFSAKFIDNGATELYYDNAKKFETTADGVTVNGDLNLQQPSSTTNYIQWDNSEGKLKLKDDIKITVGDGEDLQIYHDGSNSYLDNDTGGVRLNTASGEIQINKGTSEYMGRFITDGAVELYYDNSKKLETSSTGATVTGVVDADAFTATADTGYKFSDVTSPNDTNIPYNTWTTISTNYGWSLPSAGTYLLSSSMRVRMWDVTGLIQSRLYDNTNSSAVSNSVRMMWEQQEDTLKINVQIMLQWVHTCTGAVTIYQQFNATDNSNASSIQNDANGVNNVYWQRIG